jgi:hypothetical protein
MDILGKATMAILANAGQGRALASSAGASPEACGSSNLSVLFKQRMALSEAIEAASRIVEAYPNGGKDAGKSYLGALAAILGAYPKQVATECSDPATGIVCECRFLPTVADIVAWCEARTKPLQRQVSRDSRLKEQFELREEFEREQTAQRPARLTLDELKEKYGDWYDNWRVPGTKAAQLCERARADLIGQIGQAAFNALPDAQP